MDEYITKTRTEIREGESYRNAYWFLTGWIANAVNHESNLEALKESLRDALKQTSEALKERSAVK